MANIVINNDLSVNGKVTFDRVPNEDRSGFNIQGIILTHLFFDEITSIETKRFKLTGIDVYQESFGSDDYNIGYYFTCENVEILGTEKDGAKFILYPSEMEMIEAEMYKDEHPIMGDIGAQYKGMMIKEEETKEETGGDK